MLLVVSLCASMECPSSFEYVSFENVLAHLNIEEVWRRGCKHCSRSADEDVHAFEFAW